MHRKRIVHIYYYPSCFLFLFPWQTDCFYNAGWTEDIRSIVNHLSREYPVAPLYIVGTSIGANILV